MYPHTGQNLEDVVTEAEEEQPHPTQSEDAIPDSSYQGETNSGHAVLAGMEEVRPESRDKQDPPTQDDQRFNRALLNRNLGLSERGTNQPC